MTSRHLMVVVTQSISADWPKGGAKTSLRGTKWKQRDAKGTKLKPVRHSAIGSHRRR
jgi:hypothetical protein